MIQEQGALVIPTLTVSHVFQQSIDAYCVFKYLFYNQTDVSWLQIHNFVVNVLIILTFGNT